jgi:P-type E1-E2 ATPase
LHQKLVEVEVGGLQQLHRPCCDGEWMESVLTRQSDQQQQLGIRVDGQLAAIALIDEATIDTLDVGLANLKAIGVETLLFSGDTSERVARLGIKSAAGNLSPKAKAKRVSALQDQGQTVLFVGDGINDSAAMVVANASIALASGADLAQVVADASWYGQDLRSIAAAIQACRTTVSKLRTTLWFAVGYNSLGMLIAALGLLHPVMAAVLMLGSSLFVVIRAAEIATTDSDLRIFNPTASNTRLDIHSDEKTERGSLIPSNGVSV